MKLRCSLAVVCAIVVSMIGFSPPAAAQSKAGPFTINSSTSPCATITVTANATVGIQVTGTFSATLQPEVSIQGQSPQDTQVTPSTSSTAASTITAAGIYSAKVSGSDTFLLCVSSYVSGTATIYLNATTAVSIVIPPGASGTVTQVSGTAHQIDVASGTTTPAVSLDPQVQIATGNYVEPTGVGQVFSSGYTLPGGIISPTATQTSTSGGSLTSNPVTVEITFNTAAGETYPSAATSVSMGACVSTCQVTVTAPSFLPSGVTGYTVYDCQSGSPCTPLRQAASAACVNITGNCVISTIGAGPSVPSANTAWLQPANIQTNECPGGVQPSLFIPDQSGNLHTVAGVDENSGNSQTSGTLEFCHRTWFTDQKVSPPNGNNAFVLIDHTSGVGTSTSNQDRALWVGHQTPSGDTSTHYALEGIQSELDILATGSGFGITGSPDGEIAAGSFEIGDTATANYSVNDYGTNVIRASYFKNGAGSTSPYNVINAFFQNGDTAYQGGTLANVLNVTCSNAAGGVVTNAACAGYNFNVPSNGNRFGNGSFGMYLAGGTTATSGSDWLIRNDSPGWAAYINAPAMVSALQANNVASLPVNASVSVVGSLAGAAATAPTIQSVTCSGGSSQYTYELVGVDGNGGLVASAGANSPSACTNPLTSGNPATINPTSAFAQQALQASFVRIDVYRTGGPMSAGKIGSLTCVAGVSTTTYCSPFSDTGLSASGTAPTVNTTGSLQGYKLQTNSNCAAVGSAASPSLVACGSAAAGIFSCATNASTGTCVISTTAVTASSEIVITPSAADGTLLSVTCNTGPTSPPVITLASKSAGVSFTINLPTFSSNPVCYEYSIIN